MIKPYLNHSTEIKNLYTFRDFLKKRPKHTQQFKFSTIQNQQNLTHAHVTTTQLKLLKLLKLVKPMTKVDLKECLITNYDSWEPKLLAASKKISHIETLFMVNGKSSPKVKCFKYLPRLKSLLSHVDDRGLPLNNFNNIETHHNHLKYLKYCPKIRSVDFADSRDPLYSPKIVIEPDRYLRSLECLALKCDEWNEDQLEIPLESCKNLRSISFKTLNPDSCQPFLQIMNQISKLPNLQEIDLSPMTNSSIAFLKAFTKITEKGILKKVRLEFYHWMSYLEEILNALKPCKLTHFSLKAFIKKGFFKSLAKFLQNNGNLASFELLIMNSDVILEEYNLMEFCKQISKLQALRNLKLHFEPLGKISKDKRISNFIPYLSGAFTKSIKISTFQLECPQLPPSEALQSLGSLLENSAGFLTHLKIDIGALSCTNKTYRSILELLQNLSNIQVLEIPCLAISGPTSHFLNDLTRAIYAFKYIRVFVIGQINGKVSTLDFYNAVEAIQTKRGLRHFEYSMSGGFFEIAKKEENIWNPNVKRMIQKNPYFEGLGDIDDLPNDE